MMIDGCDATNDGMGTACALGDDRRIGSIPDVPDAG